MIYILWTGLFFYLSTGYLLAKDYDCQYDTKKERIIQYIAVWLLWPLLGSIIGLICIFFLHKEAVQDWYKKIKENSLFS